jgi:hypothetical protein
MNAEQIDALIQMLGGYLHQDWTLQFESEEAAVQAMLDDAGTARIAEGVRGIDELTSGQYSEEDVEDFVYRRVGCYFDPQSIGLSYLSWLKVIREKMISTLS